MEEEKTATDRPIKELERKILDSMTISSSKLARILLHKDIRQIITALIKNEEMTIQEISIATDKNPGTIKRHLDTLITENLVFMSKTKRSEYNVKMKYYSVVAKEFIIDIHIPEKNGEF